MATQDDIIRKSQNSSIMLRSKLEMEHSPMAEHEDSVRMTENSSLTMSPSSSGRSGEHADAEVFFERKNAPAAETSSAPEVSLRSREEPSKKDKQEESVDSLRISSGRTGRSSVEGEESIKIRRSMSS